MAESKSQRARRRQQRGTPAWARVAALVVAFFVGLWFWRMFTMGPLELAILLVFEAALLYGALMPSRRAS